MSRARPIDRMWPALPLFALGLAVLVALVGLLAAPHQSRRAELEDTVQDFGAAVQELRGGDACALLTPGAQQAVAARTGALDCPTTIRSIGYGIDGGPLRSATVTGAEVVGDRATIARAQLLASGVPYGRTFTLVRLGGHWRIDTVR